MADTTEDAPPPKRAVQREGTFRHLLFELYYGRSSRAYRFRYAMLAFDLVVVVFVVATSFQREAMWVLILDPIFGTVILLDFVARMSITRRPWRELLHPVGIADVIVIVSLIAPVFGGGTNFGFLRILRVLRVFRSYQTISRLRRDFSFFQRNQDLIFSALNLLVFILIMTAVVFETQIGRNDQIQNYADALYFTVTTLTTTGFGDITLPGTEGRLLAVLIMIFGVSLFLRLAQTVFRPQKVHFECPECGLSRHDADAVHCKHCGETINIATEGLD
jgi:voltage-gated potassium channel